MKRNPLWSSLLKSDRQRHNVKWGNPEITDKFLDKIEKENKEWKEPPEWDFVIYHYSDEYHHIKSQYTINRYWEIKSLKWNVMKYLFYPKKRWPRVRLQIIKRDKKWSYRITEKEFGILQLMEKKFWRYIPGYKKKIENPLEYILAPKNWDYNNLKYDNLHYITKNEYYNTKTQQIKNVLLAGAKFTNDQLCKMFNTTTQYILKIKHDLAKHGKLPEFQEYQLIQKEIWIEFNEDLQQVYQLLIESEWNLSNLEMAKTIRPKELSETKNRRIFTDKIVRIRKKLTDQWLIPRFNELFESKREEAVRMIKDKANSGKTNQEIADILWLKKTQIDNLSRQIKKEDVIN